MNKLANKTKKHQSSCYNPSEKNNTLLITQRNTDNSQRATKKSLSVIL
jgi:hypothetical protein